MTDGNYTGITGFSHGFSFPMSLVNTETNLRVSMPPRTHKSNSKGYLYYQFIIAKIFFSPYGTDIYEVRPPKFDTLDHKSIEKSTR
jgi:hypothetical protein